MEILITSKTHKGNSACVCGLVLTSNRLVRLLNPGNRDQFADTKFNVGDVWDIQFKNRNDIEPPHVEDVIIENKRYLRRIDDLSSYFLSCGVIIYKGSPNQIFDGKLGWTAKGSGYLADRDNLPPNSVGFWISDEDLTLDEDGKSYIYPSADMILPAKRLTYVGFAPKVNIIPQGTLMRISLARWWSPEELESVGKRCYLQLSGWYGI